LGSVNQLGRTLNITANLINVESSENEGSRFVECENASPEDISDMVSILAAAMARL